MGQILSWSYVDKWYYSLHRSMGELQYPISGRSMNIFLHPGNQKKEGKTSYQPQPRWITPREETWKKKYFQTRHPRFEHSGEEKVLFLLTHLSKCHILSAMKYFCFLMLKLFPQIFFHFKWGYFKLKNGVDKVKIRPGLLYLHKSSQDKFRGSHSF